MICRKCPTDRCDLCGAHKEPAKLLSRHGNLLSCKACISLAVRAAYGVITQWGPLDESCESKKGTTTNCAKCGKQKEDPNSHTCFDCQTAGIPDPPKRCIGHPVGESCFCFGEEREPNSGSV